MKVFIVIIFILFALHIHTRYTLCSLYSSKHIIGLTPQEVKVKLGVPEFNTEKTNIWIYQHGMDPEAYVVFDNGYVSSVDFVLWDCSLF